MPRKYDKEAAARQIDRSVWMTRQEAATYTGIAYERIPSLVTRGSLKGLQRGHWLYIERASAEKFKREGRQS